MNPTTTFTGYASTLPFVVKDLAAFLQHMSQFVGVHTVVVSEEENRVYLEGTHGNWQLYASVFNDTTQAMEDELVDLEDLVSIQVPNPEKPGELDRVTMLADGEYAMFQWMTMTDGRPDSGIYVINSIGESMARTMDEMVNQAHAAMGLPEEDSPLDLLNGPIDGPAI